MKKLSIKQKQHIKEVLKKVAIGLSIALNIIFVIVLIGSIVISSKQKSPDSVHTEVIKTKQPNYAYKINGNEYITDFSDLQTSCNLNTSAEVSTSGTYLSEPYRFYTNYKPYMNLTTQYGIYGGSYAYWFEDAPSATFLYNIFSYNHLNTSEAITFPTENNHWIGYLANDPLLIGVIPLVMDDGSRVYSVNRNGYIDVAILIKRVSATRYDFFLAQCPDYQYAQMVYVNLFRLNNPSNYPYLHNNVNEYTEAKINVLNHIFNNDHIRYGICDSINNNDIDTNVSYIYQAEGTYCVAKFISYFCDKSLTNVDFQFNFEQFDTTLFGGGALISLGRNIYSNVASSSGDYFINFIYGDFIYYGHHYNSIRAVFKPITTSTIQYNGEYISLSGQTNPYCLYAFEFYNAYSGDSQLICTCTEMKTSVISNTSVTTYNVKSQYNYLTNADRTFKVITWSINSYFFGVNLSYPRSLNFILVKNAFAYVNGNGFVEDIQISVSGDTALTSTFVIINNAFSGLSALFAYTLIPGISIGTLLAIPLVLTLLLFIIKLFKR